jgi:5-methylcytosine-specific restriction endonuclease McrA
VKECTKCGENKPLAAFHRNRARADGYHARCKACRNADQKQWTAMNPDYMNQWRRDHPTWERDYYRENRELCVERQRNYRARNRPRLRERDQAYYQANKERFRANQQAWRAANPERARELAVAWRATNRELVLRSRRLAEARRRASKVESLVAPFTQAQLEARLSMFGGKCWICRTTAWEEVDHVKPLSKHGPHILANLRPACASCNRSKRDRWPFYASARVAQSITSKSFQARPANSASKLAQSSPAYEASKSFQSGRPTRVFGSGSSMTS